MIRAVAAILVSSTCIVALATPAAAQTRNYDIAAGSLKDALDAYVRQSGRQVVYRADEVRAAMSPGVRGLRSSEAALAALLAGSGFTTRSDGNLVAIVKSGNAAARSAEVLADPAGTGDLGEGQENSDIVVTGSRIRGATLASPKMTLSRDEIEKSGQSNLGEVIRSLPQNFGGGQNPTVTVGAGGAPDNINVGAGATLNLRGVGQDATLTLINGHRVAYNAANQGVDVSAIPLEAIDRLDIVTDGSSALYGSDAVGGVANIILRRDFDGIWTSARLGTALKGGDFRQQYDVVTGSRWRSGGWMAAYDYARSTAFTAGDTSFLNTINPTSVLIPYQRHHSALASAHQELAAGLEFSIDGTFNDRWSHSVVPVNTTGTYQDYGLRFFNHSVSYSIAPALKYRFAGGWQASLAGVYSEDKTNYGNETYLNEAVIGRNKGCYCNSLKNAELSAEGPLFHLPGGDARLALGTGYREIGFHAYRTVGTAQDINVTQNIYYLYGEANLPLLRVLSFDGALRYENYAHTDQIVTPKVGLVYTALPGLQIKGTWGKSFRAPTLYEQYSVQYSSLYPVTSVGGAGYPVENTALVIAGGNPDLKSEHATSWTATLVIAPPTLTEFHAEISYYHIDYRNRVVTPITSLASSLANPGYANLIDRDPSADDVAAGTSAAYDFYNYTDAPLDPQNVVAIVDNRSRNIARQVIDGVDVSMRYALHTANAGDFSVVGNLTYLDSNEQFGPGLTDVPVSGVIFYPPHVRGRAGLEWKCGGISLSSFLNYVGKVRDNRQDPSPQVGSMTTVDLNAQYAFGTRAGMLSNTSIALALMNVNNARPSTIMTTASYFPPYDSTNYSPLGRTISFQIAKKW